MPMEASKKTATMAAGILLVVQKLSLPFVVNALIFFATMYFLVIGKEIVREYRRGVHISNVFYKGPITEEGGRIYGRCFIRMLVWFLGTVVISILIKLIGGI